MMAGDWLQGPYVYALYDHYGFSRGQIGKLFIAGDSFNKIMRQINVSSRIPAVHPAFPPVQCPHPAPLPPRSEQASAHRSSSALLWAPSRIEWAAEPWLWPTW